MSVEREFRQVLAEFELVSHGKSASYNPSGGGESEAVLPFGEPDPPHLFWRERWLLEPVSGRPALLADAREALRAWKVRQAPALDSWDETRAILEDGENFSAEDVARRFGRTASYVRRVRAAAERETEFGLPFDVPVRRVPGAEERIRNLAAQGCTERQIAFQVGVSKSTVRRALGKAA